MCLSIVYRTSADPQNVIMENVKSIECREGTVILTNIMESTLEIEGELVMADLVGGKVIVREVA